MARFIVTGTYSAIAWIKVEAEDEQAAVEEAEGIDAECWERDSGTAEVDLNVEPMVEAV